MFNLIHRIIFMNRLVCFVCLGFFVQFKNCSLIWRRSHYRGRAAIFHLRLALRAIEQWGFFSLPHQLWHGAPVYPRSRDTNVVERIAVELLPVKWQRFVAGWIRTRTQDENLSHLRGINRLKFISPLVQAHFSVYIEFIFIIFFYIY